MDDLKTSNAKENTPMSERIHFHSFLPHILSLNVPKRLDESFFSNNHSTNHFYTDDLCPLSLQEDEPPYGTAAFFPQFKASEPQMDMYLSILKRLTIMSDALMRNVLKDKDCTEYILRIIMKNEKLRIIEQTIQKDFKNLQGRSAILDCVAQDANGTLYNVEIQQESEGASPKRARYHSGLMDMNFLKQGHDFDGLPETYVIFITRDDIFGNGRPIYQIQRMFEDTKEAFNDGSHILYVNSSCQDSSKLGQLMHDLHCTKADDMFSSVLSKRVRELKETPEGVEIMCKEMDMLYRLGEERGERRGERLATSRNILRMVQKMHISPDEAMDILDIAQEEREEYHRKLV